MPPKRQGADSSGGTSKKPRKLWTTDGVDGGPSSMTIFFYFLCSGDNYSVLRGGDPNSGMTKTAVANCIVSEMLRHGITDRKPKNILEKIADLESKYRAAVDWRANTGQGVDEGGIRSAMLDRCPYFDQFGPIMSERASSRPVANSDYLDFVDECADQNESDAPHVDDIVPNDFDELGGGNGSHSATKASSSQSGKRGSGV